MRKEDFRAILDELTKCDVALELGLNVLYERGSPWWADYRLMIRFEAMDEKTFPCLESRIEALGLGWAVVTREHGSFLQIYTVPTVNKLGSGNLSGLDLGFG